MSPSTRRTLTAREIEARRRNARKSTGPRTAAGKRRSSLNALRRGLCGEEQEALMAESQEDRRDFLRLHRDLLCLLAPRTAEETELVMMLAEEWWSKLRDYQNWPDFMGPEFEARSADIRIERLLKQWLAWMARRTRKWYYLLTRSLGGPLMSLPDLRLRLETLSPTLRKLGDAPTWNPARRPPRLPTPQNRFSGEQGWNVIENKGKCQKNEANDESLVESMK